MNVERLLSLAPTVKRILVVYDPARDRWIMDRARKAAALLGIELHAEPASTLFESAPTYGGHEDLSRQGQARLLIQVTDTGKGIALDQQDHIFEWFRKFETSDATNYEGSGLGLAISKGFCELMGGTISVESRIDVGSTFTVVIPLP